MYFAAPSHARKPTPPELEQPRVAMEAMRHIEVRLTELSPVD